MMSVVWATLRALFGSVVLLQLGVMLVLVACVVTRNHVETHDLCTHSVKNKDTTLGVLSKATDAQLRKRDMEGFCHNFYSHPTPILLQKKKIFQRVANIPVLNLCWFLICHSSLHNAL